MIVVVVVVVVIVVNGGTWIYSAWDDRISPAKRKFSYYTISHKHESFYESEDAHNDDDDDDKGIIMFM